jgi:hypothetical protein
MEVETEWEMLMFDIVSIHRCGFFPLGKAAQGISTRRTDAYAAVENPAENAAQWEKDHLGMDTI